MSVPIQLARGEVEIEPDFQESWQQVSSVVRNHDFWHDPFMSTLAEPEKDPELSYKLVKTWSEQMYHGSLAFPRYVGNLIARTNVHIARRKLATNAAVEMGYPDENMSHYLLAVDMLRAIGLTDTQIVSIQMLPDSQSYIEGHLNYTRDQALARGIGCLGIGIEELTKMEFNRLGNAFIKSSQLTGVLTPEDAYREQGYFVANIMADEQHSTEFAEIGFLAHKAGEIPRDLTTCFAQIHEGARYSLDLRQKFFDGVYRKATKTQH